jgi:hypothetical protein
MPNIRKLPPTLKFSNFQIHSKASKLSTFRKNKHFKNFEKIYVVFKIFKILQNSKILKNRAF